MNAPATLCRITPAVFALCAWTASTLAVAGPNDAALVSRIEPEFPREAIQAGADAGKVKARMTVDGTGEVTRVEILESIPRRLFDRVVVKTLSQWKFTSGNAGRAVEIDIDFKR